MGRVSWSILGVLSVLVACSNEIPSSPDDGGASGGLAGTNGGTAAVSSGGSAGARGGATASGGAIGQGGTSAPGGSSCSGTPTLGTVTAAALHADLPQPGRSFLLINVRVPATGHILGTDTDIAYTDTAGLEAFIGSDKARAVTLYCQTGHTSSIAGNALVSDGYCHVRYLEGGIQAWQSAGYPVNP